MPNPQQRLWGAARTISRSPIVPHLPAPTQESEARSLPTLTFKTKAVLWIAELPTYCPFNRNASRLLDRAVLAAEAGRAAQ